jgi:hypothetical protein
MGYIDGIVLVVFKHILHVHGYKKMPFNPWLKKWDVVEYNGDTNGI